jgi:flagellar biosynthesis GTPase FlhF
MSTPAELLRALGREARAGASNGSADDPSVRTYRGRSVEDIIPQIQRELGADAIIVRRRDGLAGGVLGFFQHPYVEIDAMAGGGSVDVYDEDEPVGPPYEPPSPASAPAAPAPVAPVAHAPAAPASASVGHAPAPPAPAQSSPAHPPDTQSRTAPAAAQPPRAMPPPPRQPSPPPPFPLARPAPARGSAYVSAQLAALAKAAPAEGGFRAPPVAAPPPFEPPPTPPRPFEPSPAAPFEPPTAAPFEPPPPPPPPAVEQPSSPPPPVDFHELILDEPDLERALLAEPERRFDDYAPPPPRARAREHRAVAPERTKVGQHARARASIERGLQRVGISTELSRDLVDAAAAHTLPLAPRSGLAQAVRATIAQRIPVAPALPTRGAAIVVVGAGGTGKTTCCAALLAAYRSGSTLPASFATLARGAERGDLRLILAPRIAKPVAAATPRALGALRRARADGLAVVDTPRLSPADKAGIRALALLLGELAPERIVVALPATLGANAAAQLLTALRPLGANALAVTHADETDQIGVAIEAACKFSLAPEYLLECAPSGAWRLRRVDSAELAGRLLP